MKTKKVKHCIIGFAVSPELYDALVGEAKRQKRTLSNLARIFLQEGVSHLDRGDADIKSA